MKKRSWKGAFFDLISKLYVRSGRIGPIEPDMMPIALLCLISGEMKEAGAKAASASKPNAKGHAGGVAASADDPGRKASGTTGGRPRPVFYVAASQSRAEQ